MKAKYQTKKKFKNADDTFVYNTAKYCKIIAKRYGKNTKEIENIFNKFFEFLDEKGLLTGVVKRRINDNIKTMYFENLVNDGKDFGVYDTHENNILLRLNVKQISKNTIFHEFTHLLTSSFYLTDKNKSKLIHENKKDRIFSDNCGFSKDNFVSNDLKIENLYEDKFSIDELVAYLMDECLYLTKEEIDDFKNSYDGECLTVNLNTHDDFYISTFILCVLSNYYNFENIYINSKNNNDLLYKVVDLVKQGRIKKRVKDVLPVFIGERRLLNIKLQNKTFDVITTQYEDDVENKTDESSILNEGMTEFLTRLFMAKLKKQRYLTYDDYNLQVKYCEMMYKIFGDKIFEAFFEQDREKLASIMQISFNGEMALNKEEYLSNFEEFEKWLISACTPIKFEKIDNYKKQFQLSIKANSESLKNKTIARNNVLNVLGNCFVDKLTIEVLQNVEKFKNSSEIVDALILSILEFSKSFYFGDGIQEFGFHSKADESYRLETLHNCAEILQATLGQINYNYEAYKNLGIFNESDAKKIEKLPKIDYDENGNELDTEKTLKTKQLVEELYSWCVKANENVYYFTDTDIKEIHILDYQNGRKINMFDDKKQEYIRNKTMLMGNEPQKFPTMKKFKQMHNDIDFTN